MLLNGVLEDFNGDRDMANLRVLSVNLLGDNIEVKLDRTDPYGLITVKFIDRDTPETLSGSYTSYEMARSAIAQYVNNLPKVNKKKK